MVEERLNAFAGRMFNSAWVWKRRLYETPRPGLVRPLGYLMTASGLLVAVQGLLWRRGEAGVSGHGAGGWRRRKVSGRASGAVAWIVAGSGMAGAAAGLRLERYNRAGARLAAVLAAEAFLLGVINVGGGRPCGKVLGLMGGILDIVTGSVTGVLLGLCWYTLDPLGLHWPEGRVYSGEIIGT